MLDVMIVEDDLHFSARLAETVFQSDAMRIAACVGTVRDALHCLETIAPQVLLVDLGLPDGSGIEVIKTAARRPDCDILVISVFGDIDNVLAAIEAGATGYLLKDDPIVNYVQRIEELRSGGSPISPNIARLLLSKLQFAHAAPPVPSDPACGTVSERELEVLNLLSRGYNYHEIGDVLGISENTIRSHIRVIYRKLQVNSRSEAVFEARKLGILPR